jgi:hypothetical protein
MPNILQDPTETRQVDARLLSLSGSTEKWNVAYFIDPEGTPSDCIPNVPLDPYEIQKAAFSRIGRLFLYPYSGQWVVSRDGHIVDSDSDLQALSRRFFEANGDVDVYITKVGVAQASRIRTPFRRGRG